MSSQGAFARRVIAPTGTLFEVNYQPALIQPFQCCHIILTLRFLAFSIWTKGVC